MTTVLLATKNEFEKFIGSNPYTVVHFFAAWSDQCQTMNNVLDELAKQPSYKSVLFGKCEAEELSEVSLHYQVTSVPTIIILRNGRVCETVQGANAAELTTKLNQMVGQAATAVNDGRPLEERLKALISKSNVMVFMKGNPEQPRCGFSKILVGILNETKVPYETFDILQDEEVRQGLKEFSNWPTYPQVYVKGELIGGLDIVKEIQQSGELVSTLSS